MEYLESIWELQDKAESEGNLVGVRKYGEILRFLLEIVHFDIGREGIRQLTNIVFRVSTGFYFKGIF